MSSKMQHIAAALAGLAPVLYALEAAPGAWGKGAVALVSVLVAVGLLRAPAPAAS